MSPVAAIRASTWRDPAPTRRAQASRLLRSPRENDRPWLRPSPSRTRRAAVNPRTWTSSHGRGGHGATNSTTRVALRIRHIVARGLSVDHLGEIAIQRTTDDPAVRSRLNRILPDTSSDSGVHQNESVVDKDEVLPVVEERACGDRPTARLRRDRLAARHVTEAVSSRDHTPVRRRMQRTGRAQWPC